MMTCKKISIITCIYAVSLSACATTKPALQAHSTQFGYAVETNKAAHAIAPKPEQKLNTYIPADRDRREKARERYKNDEVKEPKSLRTTS